MGGILAVRRVFFLEGDDVAVPAVFVSGKCPLRAGGDARSIVPGSASPEPGRCAAPSLLQLGLAGNGIFGDRGWSWAPSDVWWPQGGVGGFVLVATGRGGGRIFIPGAAGRRGAGVSVRSCGCTDG